MDKFMQCAKIIKDNEYILIKKQLQQNKIINNIPRKRFTNSMCWRELYDSSFDEFANDIGHYIEFVMKLPNHFSHAASFEQIINHLTNLEKEIYTRLKICLKKLTNHDAWSELRAREISVILGITLNNKINPVPYDSAYTVSSLLNYIMSLTIQFLKRGRTGINDGLDLIPIITCDCCKCDMSISPAIPGVYNTIDICDRCEVCMGEDGWGEGDNACFSMTGIDDSHNIL